MATKVLEGRYKATVCEVDLGEMGNKGSVGLKVYFKPSAEQVGGEWKEGKFYTVNKVYWLSDKVVAKGPKAGKTSIEITRDEIKASYGYEGGLVLEDIKAALMDKEVELQCRPDPKNGDFTEVQYVNAPGGRKGLKRLPPASEDKMAKLAAAWSGKAVEEKHVDPASLFATLAGGDK